MGKIVGKKLTDRQYDILVSQPKEDVYTVYGDISKKWYIYFARCDKYSVGYDTKEAAEADISNEKFREREYLWYGGTTLVL